MVSVYHFEGFSWNCSVIVMGTKNSSSSPQCNRVHVRDWYAECRKLHIIHKHSNIRCKLQGFNHEL